MSDEFAEKEPPLSDDQIERLLEWDEALAQGSVAPTKSSSSVHSDARLAKQIRCMKLLRRTHEKKSKEVAFGGMDSSQSASGGMVTQACKHLDATPVASDLASFSTQVFPATLGKYELREEIGRGGYGVVFLAYDRAMGREVALKVPHASVLLREELLMRFRIEARAAALLDHPNIVQVFDAGNIGPVFFIATAYCPGTSLHDWLIEYPNGVSARESAELIKSLACAIQHANERGVFHRDLKPANILLQPSRELFESESGSSRPMDVRGDDPKDGVALRGKHAERRSRAVQLTRRATLSQLTARITDFGLAKLNNETLATVSGAVLGTPAYMAPEQASGQSRASTVRVDVYSLGAILYQLLTGKVPFEGKTQWETLRLVVHQPPASLRTIRPAVAKDLETICLKCLEKDPGLRYASAGQLAEDLQRFLNHEPILARNASTGELLVRLIKRKPLVSTLAMALFAAVLTGLVTVSILWKQSETRRVQIEQALGETAEANKVARHQQQTSQRLLYLNSISLAERESTVNLTRARGLLTSCDPKFRDWEWDYLWKMSNPELLDLPGHQLAARICRFSRDGRHVASGSGSWGTPSPGEVLVRETRTGRIIWESTEHLGQITGLSFHPSGTLLASADHSWQTNRSGCALVWDLESGQKVASLRLARSTFDVEFDPTGQFLATAGADGRVRLFRTENWRLARTILHHRQSVHDISFHPSGEWLASGGRDGRLCVFDCQKGTLVHEQDDLSDVRCVSFNRDGSQLACSTFSGHVLVWDTKNWKLLARHSSPNGRVGSLEYCPDGESLLVSTINGATQVWDVRSGQTRKTIPAHYPGTYYATSSWDGSLIATCGSDSHLKIWSMASTFEPKVFRIQESFISDLVAIPGRDWVATGVARNTSHIGQGDGDFSIRIVDRFTGKRIRLLTGHTSWTSSLDASYDGRLLASTSLDGSARVWDLESGECIKHLVDPSAGITAAKFFSDQGLITANDKGQLLLWDVSSGKVTGELPALESSASSLVVAKSTGWVAAADEAGHLLLRNWKNPELDLRCTGHQSNINCLCLSSDGKQLAAGGSSFEIALWDVPSVSHFLTSRTERPTIAARTISKVPGREVRDMQFLLSGERLAYASTNFNGSASVRIIDTVTGEESLQLTEREENASAIVYESNTHELMLAVNSQLVVHQPSLPDTEQRWEQHARDTLSWYAKQATLAEQQQRSTAASFYLDYLIAADPKSSQLYLRRANVLAAQQEWELAEKDVKSYAEFADNPAWSKFYLAMLELARNNPTGFHDQCDAMIEQWKGSTDPAVANTLAWVLALTPDRLRDRELMMEKSELAVSNQTNSNLRHESYNTLGLVFFRTGQYQQALECILKAIELKDGLANEADWVVMSMIQYALGNPDQSSQVLDLAKSSFENAIFLGNPVSKAHSRNWVSRFQIQLLLDEAQRMHSDSRKSQAESEEAFLD